MKCLFQKYTVILTGLALILLSSCSSTKEVVKERSKKTKPDNRKTAFIVRKVLENQVEPNTISFKASTAVKSGSKSNSFKATYRIKTDSIVWISITKVGYEAARIYATPDTLMIINRIEKKYFTGNYKYIEEKYHIHLSFYDLQAILLGNSISLKEKKKLKRSQNKDFYKLSSISKRKLKRVTEKGRKPSSEIAYVHLIDPETFRVMNISILDLMSNQSAEVKYSDHMNINDLLIPQKNNMTIRSNQVVEIESEYSKIELNNNLNFPFKIPRKYVPFQ